MAPNGTSNSTTGWFPSIITAVANYAGYGETETSVPSDTQKKLNYIERKATEVVDAGFRSVNRNMTRASHPLLNELHNDLSLLKKDQLAVERKSRLTENLEKFLENFTVIFRDTTDEKGTPILEAKDQNVAATESISLLISTLKEPANDSTPPGYIVAPVCLAITHFRELQMGWIQMAQEKIHLALGATKQAATRTSDPLLNDLSKDLSLLKEGRLPLIKGKRLIKNLNKLLDEFSEIFKNTVDESGSPVQITEDNKCIIISFIKALNTEDAPILPADIERVHRIVSHLRELQVGLIQMGKEAAVTDLFPLFTKALGNKKPISNDKIEALRNLEQEIISRTLPTKGEVKVPENKIKAIDEKINELQGIAEKMALLTLIFPGKDVTALFPSLLEVAARIKNDGKMGSEEAFTEALTRKFHAENGSFFHSFILLFHLNITAFVLQFYISHCFKEFRQDLMNFLLKDFDERIKDFFSHIIDPLKDHLSSFQSIVQSIEGKVLKKSIEKHVKEDLKTLKFDGKTDHQRISELAFTLTEKYAQILTWTTSVKKTLEERLSKAPYGFLGPIFFFAKGLALGATYALIGPLEWIFNKAIKQIIRTILRKKILPPFFQSTKHALGEDTQYRHGVNEFIRKKLQDFNVTSEGPKKSTPIKSSLIRQGQMREIFTIIFNSIPLQDAIKDSTTLSNYLKPGVTPEFTIKTVRQLLTNGIDETTSQELLKALENLFQHDLLSEFVWSVLNNITSSLKNPSEEAISKEKMVATESQMIDELDKAVEFATQHAAKTTLDPSKKFSDETNEDIENIRSEALQFTQLCQGITDQNFEVINEKWQQFSLMVSNLTRKWSKIKLEPLYDFGISIGENFHTTTKTLNDTMQGIQTLQTEKNKLTATLRILQEKQERFKGSLSLPQTVAVTQLLESTVRDDLNLVDFNNSLKRFLINTKLYQTFTKLYQTLQFPNKNSMNSFDKESEVFQTDLNTAINHFNNLITNQSKAMNLEIVTLKEASGSLDTWAKELTAEKLDFTDVQRSEIIKSIFELGEDFLINLLKNYVAASWSMTLKDYHSDGVISRMVSTYLEMPPQKRVDPKILQEKLASPPKA